MTGKRQKTKEQCLYCCRQNCYVTSRSRTFRFGRNKELVLTNKQKQFCKNLLFLRNTREKCFLRYREPATPGENIIVVYDLIFDTLCNTTPILDKCVKSIMESMFTNKNYRKKRKKCI
jgi:hypothetical protein